MVDVPSRCFVSFVFPITFWFNVNMGNSTLVLGNGEVPIDGHIEIHVKIQQFHS